MKQMVGKGDLVAQMQFMDLVYQFVVVSATGIIRIVAGDHQFDFFIVQFMNQLDGRFDPFSAHDAGNLE